ncbi:MAG TPA: NAD(P)/FAD-dependent oxidoreductase [Pseudonocardiaceae bacterium]|nr:NAD(P)/FAD-dependent oxidoreductase [Pseudonocardiaceae bacterium]
MVDAVVIGAGPNGLVAANMLADAGWEVLVLEEQPEPGGAVRSAPGPAPDFVTDLCSAFYPFGAASRAISSLELERHGLRWVHAPTVLAHPLLDGRTAVLTRDLEQTASGLEALGAGDGAAWKRLYGLWQRLGPILLDALFVPFPPVRAGARLVAALGPRELLRFARFGLLPVRRLAEEEFTGPGGSLLLGGCALHADLMPEANGSSMFGWLLGMLGQQYGYPVPEGGAGQLSAAMVRRLQSKGGQVRCDAPVREVLVRRGRAVGVRTADGDGVGARRAVLAAVPATYLYGGLVSWVHLPPRLRDDIRRFQWDYATFKLDWALRAPVPWSAADTAGAGTVHVSAGMDEMTEYTAHIAMGLVPARPFLLVGQMTTADPCRSPAGTESLWAYTHVPRQVRGDAGGDDISGAWDKRDADAFADRVEKQIERFAPGFRDLIIARTVTTPPKIAEHNANLVGGAINGGTTALHQQLVFRPTPGLGRPETPITGLYLASSSAHPGGAVHGACGANAAQAALHEYRTRSQRIAAATARFAIGP